MQVTISRPLEILLLLQGKLSASCALTNESPTVVFVVRNSPVTSGTDAQKRLAVNVGKLDYGLDWGIKTRRDVLGKGSLSLIEVSSLDPNHPLIRRDAEDDHSTRGFRVDHPVERLEPFALEAERPLELDALRLDFAEQLFERHGSRVPQDGPPVRLDIMTFGAK